MCAWLPNKFVRVNNKTCCKVCFFSFDSGIFELTIALYVCSLQVSTHGYSQNQILVWKYPSLTQVAKLTGHSYRVLYLVSILLLWVCLCSNSFIVTTAHLK